MRTCLFGGTFDPIHNGHLILAEWMCEKMKLDQMIFIPAGIPPHKSPTAVSSARHRLRMTELAILGNKSFLCSDMEIRKESPSYTEEMIEWFSHSDPWQMDDLFLLIGADSLLDIHAWKNPEHIFNSIKILVVMRPGFDLKSVAFDYLEKVTVLNSPRIDISSSLIRERVCKGLSIKYLTPAKVASYIAMNGLYL